MFQVTAESEHDVMQYVEVVGAADGSGTEELF